VSFNERHGIPIINSTGAILLGALILGTLQHVSGISLYFRAMSEPHYGGAYAEPYGYSNFTREKVATYYDTYSPNND
jgi:hypothetical protein